MIGITSLKIILAVALRMVVGSKVTNWEVSGNFGFLALHHLQNYKGSSVWSLISVQRNFSGTHIKASEHLSEDPIYFLTSTRISSESYLRIPGGITIPDSKKDMS